MEGEKMLSFSQRKGLKPVRVEVQKDDMDVALRTKLWNAFHICVWETAQVSQHNYSLSETALFPLFARYWLMYFHRATDTLPDNYNVAYKEVRDYFFKCEWYEAYDFVEFTADNAPDDMAQEYIQFCNSVLEYELSAYRFIDGHITPITDQEEIASIRQAVQNTDYVIGVKTHLKAAQALLSNRENPDYRNSIKESISAVEAIVKLLAGDPKAKLGEALKALEAKLSLHGALKQGFTNLYGYTSDAEGIRHALMDEPTLTLNDAKFMLVACTAFTNYLLGKAAENNITISGK